MMSFLRRMMSINPADQVLTQLEAGQIAGVDSTATSRGAMLSDFNMDGLVDLVVVNRDETAQIWRNTTKDGGNWFNVKLMQPAPNNDAIGSWLEVKIGDKITRREIFIGAGHASGQLGWAHMGAGMAKEAELRVIWPDGTASAWEKLNASAHYVLERGKPAVAWVAK